VLPTNAALRHRSQRENVAASSTKAEPIPMFRNVLLAVTIVFPTLIAGNAVADRRINELDFATALRHGACQKPRTSPPLFMAASPRRGAGSSGSAIPQPLAEVVDNGHDCVRDPRYSTPEAETAARHRLLINNHRFENAQLFESIISPPSR
jgi:hypothetical protein